MNQRGYPAYGSYPHHGDQTSATHKIKTAYYVTKQAVIQTLGRKEDEHLVASDAELDAKLELFKSIQKTCLDLLRVTERYQERICALSQAENEMGRFLKSRSPQDKTQAGKMMGAVGKSLSFSAQQRLALRVPLTRLQQEVETFRNRAVVDTLQTIQRMETYRTEYRAALLWMKKASEELDPDTHKQMDKFRKVQTQVRNTKAVFDKYKVDCMQKVDLLSASRCNMFSHALSLYQETLLHFWEKTSRTMTTVADSFKGYQYYEFSMLKDLAPESKKLAQTGKNPEDSGASATGSSKSSMDELEKKLEEIFRGDYKEEPAEDISAALMSAQSQASQRAADKKSSPADLLSLDDTSMLDADDVEGNKFLEDLLSLGATSASRDKSDNDLFDDGTDTFAKEWNNVFGGSSGSSANAAQISSSNSEFLDSGGNGLKIDWFSGAGGVDWSAASSQAGLPQHAPPSYAAHVGQMAPPPGNAVPASGKQTIVPSSKKNEKMANDANRWLSLFADLDPLGNPDQLSKKEGQIMDA